jgi:hypothetical protein
MQSSNTGSSVHTSYGGAGIEKHAIKWSTWVEDAPADGLGGGKIGVDHQLIYSYLWRCPSSIALVGHGDPAR